MTALFGSLGQVAPAATTLTLLYTVPALKRATVEVVICNLGAAATVRLAIAVAGAADALKQYVLYDYPMPAASAQATTRLTLAAADVVRVYASTATVAFTVNGIEETA